MRQKSILLIIAFILAPCLFIGRFKMVPRKAQDCKGPHDMAKVTFVSSNWRTVPFYRCRKCDLIMEGDDYTKYLTQEKGEPPTASTEPIQTDLQFELPMVLEGEETAIRASVGLYDSFPDDGLPWGFGL